MDNATSQPSPASPSPASPTPAADGQPAAAPAARPAYIPEKFWDGEKAAPRVEDLAKSYVKLEGERGKIKETLSAEIKAEMRKGVPAKPEDYKFAVPEGVADVVFLDAPPGEDFQPEAGKTYALLKSDDPLAKNIRALAHEYGVPNEKLNPLMTELARMVGFRPPTADDMKAARAEFTKQLGEQGEQRLSHVEKQLEAIGAGALKIGNASPAEFEAVEKLLEKTGQARFSTGSAGVSAPLSQAQLEEIMASPDYYVNREKQRQVKEGFAKLYPGTTNIANPRAAG